MPAEVHCDGAVQVCLGDVFKASVGLLDDSHYADQIRAADLATRAVDDILATVHHLLRHFDYLVELLLLYRAVDLGNADCQSFPAPTFRRREELARQRHRTRGGWAHGACVSKVGSKERSGLRETLGLGTRQRVEEVQRGWVREGLEIKVLNTESVWASRPRSPCKLTFRLGSVDPQLKSGRRWGVVSFVQSAMLSNTCSYAAVSMGERVVALLTSTPVDISPELI